MFLSKELEGQYPRLKFRPVALAIHLAIAIPISLSVNNTAYADGTSIINYDIPAGPLAGALNRFAQQSGVSISIDADKLSGLTSKGLKGNYDVERGFNTLLRGSGYAITKTSEGYTLISLPPSQEKAQALPEVKVSAPAEHPNELPKSYAGGQVAKGSKVGLLGNRGFMDTPFNATSYTQQSINDQQAKSIADVVLNDPSVRAISPNSNGSEVFNIRGFPVNNQDVSLNGLYGILPYWRGSVASAERVEILKGPTALLNGMAPSGAVGGAINVVPKRADDVPLTQFTATYISGSNYGGHIDVGRRFGPDNSVGIRFNGLYRDGGINRSEQETGEAAVGLDYRGEKLRLSTDIGYQKLQLGKVEGLMSLASGAKAPNPPDADKTYYQSWTKWENETTYGVVRGEFDITPQLTAYAAFGGRRFNDDYLFPFGFGLNNLGNFTEGFAYASSWYHTTSAEAGLRGTASTGFIDHAFSIGATDFGQDAGVLSGTVPVNSSNIYNPNHISKPALATLRNIGKTAETDLTSIAIADTLSILDNRTQLTLGLRKQQVKVDNFAAVTGIRTSSYDEDAVTPVVGLIVKPWQNVSFYGNYIEGLSQGPTAPTTANNPGQVFAPFKSKQHELGVKVDFGGFATTLSVFQISKPSGLTNPITNVYGVDGEQKNRGIELNAFGEIVDDVRFLGGIMFLDAKQTKTANGTFDDNYAVNSPKFTANMGLDWDTLSLPGLSFNARVIYTDSAYIDTANNQEIPSWTRFDVGARYKLITDKYPVMIRANIENIFDKTYWMSTSLYRGNPRTLTLSATINF